MKKTFTYLFLIFSFSILNAQTEVTFESFGLAIGESNKDAGVDGGFSDGNIFLPNSYNPTFDSFSGWAISADDDTTTPGFMNDVSAITGSGYDGSNTYAVSFSFGANRMDLTGGAAGGQVNGFYITNGTYPYLSMKEGDSFAKKFGGESGDDPDYFLLTIMGYENGQPKANKVEFYLADYRFEDNSQDYIVDEWTWLDLTSIGNVDSLKFQLTSTDNGTYGMNTPAYFCIDNVITSDMPTGVSNLLAEDTYSIFPNPFSEYLNIDWKENTEAEVDFYNASGQLVKNVQLRSGQNQIYLHELNSGQYVAKISSEGKVAGQIVLKK